MAGEIAIDKTVTNDHTFGYLFGLVKVRHILTEQYIRAQTSAMCGKGDYIHTVKVYVCGTEVFSFEGHCSQVGEVYIEGDRLVGSTLIKKKRL